MSNSKKTSNKILENDKPNFVGIIVSITIIIITFLLLINAYTMVKSSCNSIFEEAYVEEQQSTYDGFKKKAYDYFEKQNHVSNQATITIGKIKEKNSLEVLSVSDTCIKITDSNEDVNSTTRWVEFNAIGIYTVDMSTSEFIIDNYNHKVLVKLKTPQLSFIKLGKPKVYHYEYEKVNPLADGNYDDGVKMALNDRAEAYETLTEKIETNYTYKSKARQSTESLIRTFIKNVNPEMDLHDSDIQIEFY